MREPGAKQNVVAMTATRGLVSRSGSWGANLIRERFGPECRSVEDLAKVLDVIRGYDPEDPITATQVSFTPPTSLASFTKSKTLTGKRLGIVREFMPNITVNDADTIRVFNEQVIPTLRAAGAQLVESINPRDVANGWSSDDPTIPNMDIQSIVAEMIPTLFPSFANASTVPSPTTTTGLLPNTLREVFSSVPSLFPAGTDVIQKSVEMVLGITPFPDVINLRKLENGAAGTMNQGRYALDKMLVLRGDPRVKSVVDLSIDFDDFDNDGDTTEHLSFFAINANTGAAAQKTRPGVTPGAGVPATASGLTLDTQGEATHLFIMQTIREIVARIMADYDLDALVYPYETIPPPILVGTVDSIPWLNYDGRPARGYNAFTDASGLPDIGVPAGFTSVVYDRTTRGNSEALALDPPAVQARGRAAVQHPVPRPAVVGAGAARDRRGVRGRARPAHPAAGLRSVGRRAVRDSSGAAVGACLVRADRRPRGESASRRRARAALTSAPLHARIGVAHMLDRRPPRLAGLAAIRT